MKNEIVSNYRKNTLIIKHIVDGLDSEMLLRTGESNTVGWILGHLKFCRGQVLQMLEVECGLTEEEKAFERGVEKNVVMAIDMAETMEGYTARGVSMEQAILALEEDDFKKPIPFELPDGSKDIGGFLSFLAWHETFHIGQIDLIIAATGKGGVK